MNVRSLSCWDDQDQEWKELIVEDRRSTPADVAAFRVDFREIRSDRSLAETGSWPFNWPKAMPRIGLLANSRFPPAAFPNFAMNCLRRGNSFMGNRSPSKWRRENGGMRDNSSSPHIANAISHVTMV